MKRSARSIVAVGTVTGLTCLIIGFAFGHIITQNGADRKWEQRTRSLTDITPPVYQLSGEVEEVQQDSFTMLAQPFGDNPMENKTRFTVNVSERTDIQRPYAAAPFYFRLEEPSITPPPPFFTDIKKGMTVMVTSPVDLRTRTENIVDAKRILLPGYQTFVQGEITKINAQQMTLKVNTSRMDSALAKKASTVSKEYSFILDRQTEYLDTVGTETSPRLQASVFANFKAGDRVVAVADSDINQETYLKALKIIKSPIAP